MPLDGFDFKNPDYVAVFNQRLGLLRELRQQPHQVASLMVYYREHPWQFIIDWGCTVDPRNTEIGLPSVIPFILFPKQIDWIKFVVDCWHERRGGVTEKSRDMGLTWLSVSLSSTMCLTRRGMAIGFGSRKEEYVDKLGDPKCIFWKGREFLRHLPPEFLGGFNPKIHAPHMRIIFPGTESIITGEAGDGIGRGDRTGIYFVDEAAHLDRPELVDASLSQTTNCRQDISTPYGMANSFARKVHAGKVRRFTFSWRDDPRKNQAWYDKTVEELDNDVIVAQEIDLDYSASVEGVLIPSAWVEAAVDADQRLGFEATGASSAAMDVADGGGDQNAFAGSCGVKLEVLEEWSGRGSDMLYTTQRAFDLCDEHDYDQFKYDGDGLGAGVKGMARGINETRLSKGWRQLRVETFRGSAAPFDPDREDVKGRKNKDFFMNLKAQGYWRLRMRFQATYLAVKNPEMGYDPDELIVIPSGLKLFNKLKIELSQPTWAINSAGKLLVDKAPDGARSPNLSDVVMILNARARRPSMKISADTRERFSRPPYTPNSSVRVQAAQLSRGARPAGVLGPLGASGVSASALSRFRR